MIEEVPDLVVVDEVGDGPNIFAALEREPIDCLLIDVSMPDFEPITAIHKIRQLYPDLKILVVSAYAVARFSTPRPPSAAADEGRRSVSNRRPAAATCASKDPSTP